MIQPLQAARVEDTLYACDLVNMHRSAKGGRAGRTTGELAGRLAALGGLKEPRGRAEVTETHPYTRSYRILDVF